MHVHWLIENNIFDYAASLVDEVNRQQFQARLVDYAEGVNEQEILASFPDDACVIAHGSLQFSRLIHDQAKWTPGAWCNLDGIRYSVYSQPWSEFLLNRDVSVVTYSAFMEQFRREISESRAEARFVRPDSGAKEFPGMIVTAMDFEEKLGWYEDDVPADLPMIVAQPKAIAREWRFMIAGAEVITGCEYSIVKGRRRPGGSYVPEAAQFAAEIASGDFRPDALYVLDVCETASSPGEFFVIEPNSFSGSDWYSCDLASIVRETSRIAWSEWQQR